MGSLTVYVSYCLQILVCCDLCAYQSRYTNCPLVTGDSVGATPRSIQQLWPSHMTHITD